MIHSKFRFSSGYRAKEYLQSQRDQHKPDSKEYQEGIEKEIPLNEVPDVVLKAAQKAVPGIVLTEAEVEKTSKGVVYEIEGTLDGKDYEIELSSDELNALYVIFEMQDDADYFDGSASWIQSIGEEGELNDSSPEKMRGGLIISCLPYYKVSESTDIEEFVEKENCHEEHRFCGVRLKTS